MSGDAVAPPHLLRRSHWLFIIQSLHCTVASLPGSSSLRCGCHLIVVVGHERFCTFGEELGEVGSVGADVGESAGSHGAEAVLQRNGVVAHSGDGG